MPLMLSQKYPAGTFWMLSTPLPLSLPKMATICPLACGTSAYDAG